APLHDGAMILQHNQVIAAGCFLPLTERSDIKKSLGTRHRAAIGLSEETDAVILIISEETGAVSLAIDGKLRYDLNKEKLTETLSKVLLKKAKRTRRVS
ncbi:MAG: DNA integrity scanning protein DisA nucleotide-binding domain protein, partial [Spirochaetes bacterium]|nr:DNA integrity scanning protein DisA nucleotide-binding domain protein [Spirochaetota bacterium]